MITLYQPSPSWGLPNMSPFCVKMETYLRMAKIEYKTVPGFPLKGPKGRIPWIKLDGRKIGDTAMIIEELKLKFGDPLDGALTPGQKAQSLALRSLVEDRLYFAAASLRWADDASWVHVKKVLSPIMPPLIGGLILGKIRKSFLSDLSVQGIGDHSRPEIREER